MGRKKKEGTPQKRTIYNIRFVGGPKDGEEFECVYLLYQYRFAFPEWCVYVRVADGIYEYKGTEPVQDNSGTLWWGNTTASKRGFE